MNEYWQCMPCMNGCIACTGGVETCDECRPNYYLKLTASTGHCEKCDEGVDYCNSSGALICMHGYTLNNISCVKDCDQQCALCKSGVCYEAMPGRRIKVEDGSFELCYYDNCKYCPDDKKQCNECKEGFWYEQERGCEPCHSDCRTCTGPGQTECVLCPVGRMYQRIYKVLNDYYWTVVRIQSKYMLYVEALLTDYKLQTATSTTVDNWCLNSCPGSAAALPGNYPSANFYTRTRSSFVFYRNQDCRPWVMFNQS